jgi:hypothetical protein
MTLAIGTISHGTLRNEDLASAIHAALKSQGHKESDVLMRELRGIANGLVEDNDSETVSDGIEALNDHVPMFCYAGFHPGDGSDLGVWPDHEMIESAIADGDAIQITDLADLDSLAISELHGANVAILVNDHGNISVYQLNVSAQLMWDCV